MKLKLAVIGAGRMGITHYSIINSHPSVDLVAVADPSSMVINLMKKYLPDLQVFKEYKSLILTTKPDAILVCTPPDTHYEIVEFAYEHNIHVFVEKPFTLDMTQGHKLLDHAGKKRLVNQVGYVNRFNDVFIHVKKLVNEQKVVGDIIRYRSEMFSRTVIRKDDGSGWRGKHETGGGCLYEMGSHAIDLVNYIIGKPDKVTGSSLNKVYSKYVEDIVSTTFLYKNGITGTLYVNWSDQSYRKPSNKLEIFGTKGKIIADQHGFKLYLNEKNDLLNYREGWNTIYITDVFQPVPFYVRGNEFTRQLYHFIECIQNQEKENMCSFSDAFETQQVIDEIFNDYNTLKKL